MSLKEATCSNKLFLRSSLGVMEGIKWKRNEKHSDRSENHDRNRLYLRHFEVEKVKFVDLICCVPISRIVVTTRAGSTFSKKS